MSLNKIPIPVNFAQGINTKADSKQLAVGNFLSLVNSVFDVDGQLTKRFGTGKISQLPNLEQTTITTLNDNLLATGSNLYAYSANNDQWLNQGLVQPVEIDTMAIVRSATSQNTEDLAIAESGLACVTYMDANASYYNVFNINTGQQIVSRVSLPATATLPRVFLLNKHFVITYLVTIGTTHLQFIAVPIERPSTPNAAVDITTAAASLTAGYDAVVANNTMYVSYATSGTSIETRLITAALAVSSPVTIASSTATLMSLTADMTQSTPVIWVSFYDSVSQNGYTAAYNQILNPILVKTLIITGIAVNTLTSIAQDMLMTAMYERQNTYSYTPNAKTDFVNTITCTQAGSVGSTITALRAVGLASKAFINADNNTPYVWVTYGEAAQPTYFLIDFGGQIIGRLAYANGGGYAPNQILPNVPYHAAIDRYVLPYLFKSSLVPVNKGTNLPAGTPSAAIYTPTGVNIAKFSINTDGQYSSEIADVLTLTGGQTWMYDGVRPVEQGFQVYPENVAGTTSAAGGLITAGDYYYSFTYEWTDNKGQLHRSAPSIPVKITTTGATSSNTLNVPTLRLTYKRTPNPVRIVGYRWSVAQQVYYQFTSITAPVINDPTVDSVAIVDTLADSAILGNAILYTTGGVIENIAPPASKHIALYKNRAWLINAENPNVLWFSKQVIQETPVEFSDLFTVYVAPTTGAQGSTGDCTALSAMDDKLIIFKEDAIYYLTGTGPDNTGANNDFTDPTFITASVGTANPDSIVLMPNGIMFQSDKGIWLLGRDLSTRYIGADVQLYNNDRVESAKAIPDTNQVRFELASGVTLMYDYFMDQWGTFVGRPSISSTLYQGFQTFLNKYGEVLQETPDKYLDGSKPVTMQFTTSWLNIAGVQGYERFYQMYLLGSYISPFNLSVTLAYDYNESATQQITVSPDNFTPYWGGENVWGGSGPWGGPGKIFEARIFPQTQKCQSFQVSVQEMYDSTKGQTAGAGLTLSGLNLIIGAKKGYRVQKASQSFG